MILDDAILLRRYAEERVEEAFAEVVRRHLDRVYSSALRRLGGDVQLAQDVSQEVFVALAREAAQLSRHPAISGWLHLTTRNVAANVVRVERRRKAREEEIQRMSERLSHESSELDWSRLAPVLEEALDQLSESDRLTVLLRFVEQRSFSDVGRVLGLSDEAARKRADRALDKLRLLLERQGIVSTAAALGLALTNQAVTAAPAGFAAAVTGVALAATPAGAATLLGIMSTTKLVMSCVAVAGFVAALGIAGYEYHVRSDSEASLKNATEKGVALIAERNALEAQATTAEADAARLKKETDAARAAQAAANSRKATANVDESGWDPKKEGTAFLERHPEARQALRERFLAGVRSSYGALFKTLGLTPEQSEQFALFLIRGSGLGGTGTNGGKYISYNLDSEDPNSERWNALQKLLGKQGWEKYQEYSALLPARDLTTKIASRLSFTDASLTPAQSDQLVALLASNQAREPKVSVQQFDWDTILREAREFLSPTQQSALEFSRAEADFHLAMNSPTNTGKSTTK